MHNDLVTYADLLRNALAHRLTMARALEVLRGHGASPPEAVEAVVQVTGATRDNAREMVRASRAWLRPRSGVAPGTRFEHGYGAIGQHGRSGHGAASVLAHLARPAPSRAGSARSPRR